MWSALGHFSVMPVKTDPVYFVSVLTGAEMNVLRQYLESSVLSREFPLSFTI